jgi:subtilisin family serine protease
MSTAQREPSSARGGAVCAGGMALGWQLRLAAVALVLLAFCPADAQAQLRGLGGGGGIGGVSIGGGAPGLPAPGLDGLGAAVPQSGVIDRVTPALPSPDALDTTVNSAPSAVLDTIADPLAKGTQIGDRLAGRRGRSRPSGVPPAGERRFVLDEVMVSIPSNISRHAFDELARRHRLSHLESQVVGLTQTTFHRLRIADRRAVPDVIRALEAEGVVTAAQPNYRFTLQQSRSPADAAPPQYALAKLRLPQAHRFATGEGVLVAVIDSGIDLSHPEIAGRVAGSLDLTDAGEPADIHGTAMAGAIIARGRLTGVAPGARILAIRAFDARDGKREATTLMILRALDWAVTGGARVVNMSFAGPKDPEITRGIAAARQRGVVLIAAAGNAGPKSPPLFPAADPNVIAVTATDAQDKLLPVAIRGAHVGVAAPGVDILGPAPGGGYQLSSGTSIAAAHVSGIAALLIAHRAGLSSAAVRKSLLSTATDLGPPGRDDQFGAGLADAHRAIQALQAQAARPGASNVSAARQRQ